MREQLRLLEELQRHDMKLQELDAARKALPAKLAVQAATIAEIEKLLQRERAELEDTEAFRKDTERQQKDAESLLQKSKAKQGQVRNAKEGEASTRELDSAKKVIDSRGEDLGKLTQVLTEQRAKFKEHEDKLAAEQKEYQRLEAAIAEQAAKMEQDLVAARAAREEAAKALRPDSLRKYAVILHKKRGSAAVVAVRDGTCRGCNMNIPPQLYNIIQRGNSLELCPNCNRIIYWSKLLESPPEPGNNGAKS